MPIVTLQMHIPICVTRIVHDIPTQTTCSSSLWDLG